LIVSPYTKRITTDDLKRYRDLGISEVPIMVNFDEAPANASSRVEQLAKEWVEPASKL
jgi:hypothetical protein